VKIRLAAFVTIDLSAADSHRLIYFRLKPARLAALSYTAYLPHCVAALRASAWCGSARRFHSRGLHNCGLRLGRLDSKRVQGSVADGDGRLDQRGFPFF
jgi:hypothetical protein